MAEEYITDISEKMKKKVTKNLSQEKSRTESRILVALSKFDQFPLNPKVRTCSVAVPETFKNHNSENREPTGERSLNDPCPKLVSSAFQSGRLNDSKPEETLHRHYGQFPRCRKQLKIFFWNTLVPLLLNAEVVSTSVRSKKYARRNHRPWSWTNLPILIKENRRFYKRDKTAGVLLKLVSLIVLFAFQQNFPWKVS